MCLLKNCSAQQLIVATIKPTQRSTEQRSKQASIRMSRPAPSKVQTLEESVQLVQVCQAIAEDYVLLVQTAKLMRVGNFK